MSRSLNKITLIGNVGADPEIRTTNNGGRVANFSIATSRQWGGGPAGGEKQEKTEWHKIVAWDNARGGFKLAELVEKYVKKGDKLYVEGRVEYRQWQDKENQTRYVTEIIANEVLLLSGRGGGPGGGGGEEGGGRPARAPSAPKAKGAESGGDFEEFDATEGADDDLPF